MQYFNDSVLTDLVKDSKLSECDFSKAVSDSHVNELSMKYDIKFELLCPWLDLDTVVAKDIKNGPGSASEKRCAFFMEWKKRKGSAATYRALVIALLKINHRNEAEYLCNLLERDSKIATDATAQSDGDVASSSSSQPISAEHYKEIRLHYTSYVNFICTSLQDKGITTDKLRLMLLYLPAFDETQNSNQSKSKLLADRREKLEKATSIDEIFVLLRSELLSSYLNYEIFDYIVKQFHLDESEESLRYPEYLDVYAKLYKISECMKLPTITNASKELEVKIDFDLNPPLAKIMNLKDAVSDVLGQNSSVLRFQSIEEGVVVKFLVSSSVAECILGKKSFTQTQVQMLRDLLIAWLKCSGTTLYFRNNQAKTTKFSDQYAEMSIDGHDNIGNGLFGSVFRGRYKHHHCAAKLLTHYALDKATDDGQLTLKDLCEKCTSLKELSHENIVHHLATAIEPISSLPILLSELMDCNLKQLLENQKDKFSVSCQLSICHDIAKGLEFLHSQKIIHLNIRDSNILISLTEGDLPKAKVGDFAMSRILPHHTIVASPPAYRQMYFPPEKLEEYNCTFDIYSFGVIAVQVVKLKTGLKSKSELKRQLEEIPNFHVLKKTIQSCLSDNPKKRPQATDLVRIIYSNHNVF